MLKSHSNQLICYECQQNISFFHISHYGVRRKDVSIRRWLADMNHSDFPSFPLISFFNFLLTQVKNKQPKTYRVLPLDISYESVWFFQLKILVLLWQSPDSIIILNFAENDLIFHRSSGVWLHKHTEIKAIKDQPWFTEADWGIWIWG